jgi:hypothetical protein
LIEGVPFVTLEGVKPPPSEPRAGLRLEAQSTRFEEWLILRGLAATTKKT